MSSYIFPDAVAKVMAKIDQRTQMEATMLSLTLMSIGLILSVVYACIYLDIKLWFKIVLAINGLFGLMFMYSSLITAYQQYLSFMQARDLQEQIAALNTPTITVIDEMKGGNIE